MFPHGTLLDDDEVERKAIQRRISSLEELEMALGKRYGMVGIIDPVEVFDEAKRRAFANDAHSKKDLRALDRLNHLRLQLAHLRRSHMVPPPANVGTYFVSWNIYIHDFSSEFAIKVPTCSYYDIY